MSEPSPLVSELPALASPKSVLTRLEPLLDEGRNPWLKVLATMGDGLLLCWKNHEIAWMNSVLQAKLERSPVQLTAEMLPQVALDSSSPVHELGLAINEVLETGEPFQQEIKLRVGLGRKKHFEIWVVPVSEDLTILEKPCHRWVGCLAVFRDITPMKNTEKMRKDFVANVSHELRTPLSVLKGYTETLLDGALQEPEVAQQFVETMARHADRLSQLVEDLLDLSRLESEESPLVLESLALGQLLSKVISMSRDSATLKQIELEYDASFESEASRLWVLAHSASLEQVLVNLIDNAIKYTPEHGTVQVLVSLQADLVQVAIKDNGIGIPAKHIPRLFERFYRVDKARSREMGGTGLGLSIVKHIVQAQGGDIWVASEPEKGSTFYFTLRKTLTPPVLNVEE